MASTYTTNAGIELIATGEQSGTWGDTTNTNLQIIDRLTNGVGAISLSGTTHTLTTSDGTLSDGQYAVLVFGGTPSGTNTVTISPNTGDHLYVVKNNSGQSVILTQGSGGNVTVADGKSAIVYADGAGAGAAVVDVTSTFNFQPLDAELTAIAALSTTDGNFIVGNGSTWVAESGATARTSLGLGSIATQNANNVAITGGSVTGITDLAVADGGTGVSTVPTNGQLLIGNGSGYTVATLTAGTGTSISNGSGSITISATGSGGTVTSVGGTGTVNGITLTGTVTSSGNLTLGGTLSISNADWSGTDLSVANGGTGASSFTANNVLLGNGTSAFQTVAPGTSGNVLTSNGTTWTSAAPAGGGNTRDFTATGAITAGDIVSLLSDGTVSTTEALEYGSLQNDTSSSTPSQVGFDVKNNVIAFAFSDTNNSSYATLLIGTISSGTVTWGTPTVITSATMGYPMVELTSNASHVVVFWNEFTTTQYKMVAASISGTTPTFGSIANVGGSGNSVYSSLRISDTSFFLARTNGDSYAVSRSGTTLTTGSSTSYSAVTSGQPASLLYDSTQGDVHIGFVDSSKNAIISTVSVSGTTVTAQSTDNYLGPDGGTSSNKVLISKTADSDTFLYIFGGDYGAYDYTFYGTYTYNGSSVTPNTFGMFIGGEGIIGTFKNTGPAIHLGNNHFVTTAGGGTNQETDACVFFTLMDGVVSEYLTVGGNIQGYISCTSTAVTRPIRQDTTSSSLWKVGSFIGVTGSETGNFKSCAVNVTWADANPFNWVGMAEASVSNGATVTCTIIGGVNSNQTGLTAGRPFSISGKKVGTALSATEVLITGADK